jgi:hypothetical protein
MNLRQCVAVLRSVAGRRARIDDDASGIARRSHWVVLGRIGIGAREMGRSELRGYVRARAALVIRREAGTLLAGRRNASDPVRQRLIDLATRKVVDLAVADLAEVWAWKRSYDDVA